MEQGLIILQKRVVALSKESLERFVLRARRAAGLHGIANILVTSSAAVKSLNLRFRGKEKATDVLSFPSALPLYPAGRKARFLAGDIAISADIAAQNAARLGHSVAEEVKILTLHGILHLAGLDHERDNGDMARKEMKLRRALGLPAGLIERAQPTARPARSGTVKRRHGTAPTTKARRMA